MVYSTYKNGGEWGMVYYCFNHIIGSEWNILDALSIFTIG